MDANYKFKTLRSKFRATILLSLAAMLSCSLIVPIKADDSLKLPPVKRIKLKNGLSLLLIERPGVPIISFNFIVKTGSTADPIGKEGLAELTSELLRKGTKSRNATRDIQ